MPATKADLSQELCPSCGDFVNQLNDTTGFCDSCSGDNRAQCMACGEKFVADQPYRKLCRSCRDERWLERHADELEDLLSYGARIAFAKRQVYRENRPLCIACGDPIKGVAKGALFCTRTIDCRRWRRRYKTLREKYNSESRAKKEVAAEIFAASYNMGLK